MLIAQISDLHIRMPGQKAYRVVETDRFLPPAIDTLNRLDPAPDLVIISGDLTDFGKPQEYAHLKSMLDQLRLPYFLMPGNHDARDAMVSAFPDHHYLQAMPGFVQYAVEEYPLRLLMLDTVVPQKSHGTLCEQRLQWLRARLAEQPDRPTVIVMHHPPFATGIAYMDAIGLLAGTEALHDIVSSHPNVERILCGHLHRTIFRRFAGTIASTCPGPAHQVALDLRPAGEGNFIMEPPGYHLHEWRDGAVVTHHAYIGAYPGPYPFREDAQSSSTSM